MIRVVAVVSLCLLILMPVPASAMHPFIVKDTETEGEGNFLFELTGDFVKSNEFRTTQMKGIFTVGIARHADLSIEVPYLWRNPGPAYHGLASGIGDIRFAIKQQLFKNEVKQSMAYQFYVDAPTGNLDKALGKRDAWLGLKIIDTQVCKTNCFNFNLGYEVYGRDLGNWHFMTNYSLPFGISREQRVTDTLRVLLEIAGEHRTSTDPPTGVHTVTSPFTFMGGVVYDFSRLWYVDAGIRAGLNKYAEDYAILMGTAVRF